MMSYSSADSRTLESVGNFNIVAIEANFVMPYEASENPLKGTFLYISDGRVLSEAIFTQKGSRGLIIFPLLHISWPRH